MSPNHLNIASPETLSQIKIIDRREYPSGLVVEKVSVPDASQESETFFETRQLLNDWDNELSPFDKDKTKQPIFDKKNNTITSNNIVSERFYDDESIREWGLLMPSAKALYYLTHLDVKTLPSGQPISETMTRFMREMDDGIGIRTRKNIASEIVMRKIKQSNGNVQCLSLACGAADLMIETIADSKIEVMMTLVDIDDDILSMAQSIATEQGFIEGYNLHIKNANLIDTMVRHDYMVETMGEESQLVVEAIGITEYFKDNTAAEFLKNAYRCVAPGGSLITANMLSDRPQMRINKLGIGWPKINPRSVEDIIEILKKAGLPLEHTKITIPEDGVYAVIEITKPKEQLYNAA